MNEKLLSVILPVYNTEAYFRDCLFSLLPQLDDRAEVIIIDDGCTDLCPLIAEDFQKWYPSVVKIIHQENLGNTLARYAGIKAASGEYIGFMDSDDLADPCWYEEITSIIDAQHPDMILLRWQKFDDEGHLFETDRPPLFDSGPVLKDDVIKVFVSSQRLTGLPVKVIRRVFFTDFHDWSDRGRKRLMEDKLISIQLFEGAKTYWYLSKVLYHYRTNLSSITVRTHVNEHYTLQYTYPPMMDFLKRTGYDRSPYRELLIENYASVMWEIILKTHRTLKKEEALAVFSDMRGFSFTSYLPPLLDGFSLAEYKKAGLRLLLEGEEEALYEFAGEIRKNPDLDHMPHLRKLGKI